MQNGPVNWFWQIDEENHYLNLWLSKDIKFVCAFTEPQLNGYCNGKVQFTTEDVELYSIFRDTLAKTQLDQESQFSVAINATAACNYLTPLATKSWLYSILEPSPAELFGGDIVILQTVESAYYLVLESDNQTSTLILISKKHHIDSNRMFSQSQTVKVHNDRIKKVLSIRDISI